MAQISRPFQIALLALVVLAGVWFFALQGHSTSGSSAPASTATPAPRPASTAPAKGAGSATPVYHGAAPGVEGLSRAIANAHKAVATSEQNAKQLATKSAQASTVPSSGGATGPSAASSEPTPASVAPTTSTASPTTSTASHPSAVSAPAATKKATSPASPSVTGPNGLPAKQVLVEQELKQGAVVAVLFWNPNGAVDVAVQRELQLLLAVHHGLRKDRGNPVVRRLLKAANLELDSKIAVNEALASQVASFGSITRAVQVYQTPTILIINRRGQTTTLTGLTDAFSIEQAIDEARHQ